jgi:hypothetical protein
LNENSIEVPLPGIIIYVSYAPCVISRKRITCRPPVNAGYFNISGKEGKYSPSNGYSFAFCEDNAGVRINNLHKIHSIFARINNGTGSIRIINEERRTGRRRRRAAHPA